MNIGAASRPATVYHPSVPRLVLMIAASLAFVGVGIAIAFSGRTPPSILVAIAVCIAVLAGACVSCVDRLLRRGPELVLTDDGLDHRRYGAVRWDEVASVRIRGTGASALSRTRVLQIGLRDPEDFYVRSARWTRWVSKVNGRLGYGHVNLKEAMLGAPIEQVLHTMTVHRRGADRR
ncbi:STM3941 family protein [Nocardia sp. NPDC004415]